MTIIIIDILNSYCTKELLTTSQGGRYIDNGKRKGMEHIYYHGQCLLTLQISKNVFFS